MKKRTRKRFLPIMLLLCAVLIVNSFAACGKKDITGREETEETSEDRSEGTDNSGKSKSDKSGSSGKKHTVTFAYDREEAEEAPEAQTVADGEKAVEPQHASVEGYVFVAWLPDDRRSLPYDFSSPVTEDLSLTGYYLDENATEDTDEDGLPDALEDILGTDENAWDTDKDGLFDGLEYLLLSLDPLAKDTDDNDTPDGEEDTDGDEIENAKELDLRCNPAFYDTDSDGLNDYDEVFVYETDPQNKDTDGDGVTDGQEILLGTDPLTAETAFTTVETTDDFSEQFPVDIEVKATTDAAGAGTLLIEQLVTTDIPALTAASIGYLAPGYDLTCEGRLEEATITFSYDPALGEGRENFLPTIYWYNEETSELIEVPGQIRDNGTITATVTHFSKYILLDKNPIDLIREKLHMPTAEQMVTDENGDGLPDIVVEWLSNGEILFDNTYMLTGVLDMYGFDSVDWDDDGLPNGQEIEIGLDWKGQPDIVYHSNPILADTDFDGFSDYDEVETLNTSPRKYNHTSGSSYNALMSDAYYQYMGQNLEGMEETVFNLIPGKQEKAKQFLINYIYDYAPQDTIAENAEKIAQLEQQKQFVEYLGLAADMLKLYKDAYTIYKAETKLDDLKDSPVPKLYTDGLDIRKDAIHTVNSKRQDVLFAAAGLQDTRMKVENAIEDIKKDDNYKKISGLTTIITECTGVISAYEKATTYAFYSFEKGTRQFEILNKSLKGKTDKISTGLTVAVDVAKGVQDIADINVTYGKIRANLSAYNRYLEMLDYMREHAEDGFVKDAARELEEMVLDTEGAYVEQLSKACAESAVTAITKTVIDATANTNPYSKLAKTIIDLYQWTGMVEFTNYNIYFRVMKAVSNGCKNKLDSLIKREGSTFCYDVEDTEVVRDYLVQLAQSRIIGQYNVYEYNADNSLAGYLSYIDPHSPKKTPAEYRADGKNNIKRIYDDANRLQLPLSSNLPYYGDFFDPTVPPDELYVVLDSERALKDAAGIYLLASGAGAWETRFELKKDGTFSGYYYDMNMGESGIMDNGEAYEGTQYERRFTGRFEVGTQLDDYSYELTLAEYAFEGTDGEEHIEYDWGATRFVNSAAPGLEGWDTFVLFSPSAPTDQFPYEPWTLTTTEQDYMIGFGHEEEGELRGYFWRTEKVSYSSYSTAYAAFVGGKQYLNTYNVDFGTQEAILTAIHDLDMDGVPELILTNGYTARTDRAAYIYEYQMGQVVYLGIGPSDGYYLDDPKYPGVFGKFETNWWYYTKHRYSIQTEKVAEGFFDPPFTQITSDDALYQAFETGPRKPLYAG